VGPELDRSGPFTDRDEVGDPAAVARGRWLITQVAAAVLPRGSPRISSQSQAVRTGSRPQSWLSNMTISRVRAPAPRSNRRACACAVRAHWAHVVHRPRQAPKPRGGRPVKNDLIDLPSSPFVRCAAEWECWCCRRRSSIRTRPRPWKRQAELLADLEELVHRGVMFGIDSPVDRCHSSAFIWVGKAGYDVA